jgi:hypothetical protein
MSERYPLTLHQADEARTDFAAVESDLEFIMAQLARIPTRKEQARNTLGKVERWAIDRLIPYAKNARTHTDAQVAAIAASIKEWGRWWARMGA